MKIAVVNISLLIWGLLWGFNFYSMDINSNIYKKSPSNNFRQILNLNIGYVPVRSSKKECFRSITKGHLKSRFAVAYGIEKGGKYVDSIFDSSKIFLCNPNSMINEEPDMVLSDIYEVVEFLFRDVNTAERVYADCISHKVYLDSHRNLVIKKKNALYLIISHNDEGAHLQDISEILL